MGKKRKGLALTLKLQLQGTELSFPALRVVWVPMLPQLLSSVGVNWGKRGQRKGTKGRASALSLSKMRSLS